MKKYFTELIQSNWFFLSLVGFVIALPLSVAFVSIFAGIILATALIEDRWQNKLKRIKRNRILLLIPAIFILYLVSTLFALRYDQSFYDVKKVLFYLVIPIAFSFGKELNNRQKRFLLSVFVASIFLAIFISVVKWVVFPNDGNFSVHKISLISHIRFSFQLILGIWFLIYLIILNYSKLTFRQVLILSGMTLIVVMYLVFQQSLTGILAFLVSGLFFLFYLFNKIKGEYKVPVIVGFILLIIVPLIYIQQVVRNFYRFDLVDQESVEQFTVEGNPYHHDFNNKMIENGHYVGLYVCENEMREAWNKRSEFKYDSIGLNGYRVSATLIRYLTSKDLRKDAAGVQSLKSIDVQNIEHGMANYIFQKKYSLYPRIYQTVWEYYVYTQTGNSNHQSFSQRIEFAKAAITIIKKYPLLGVGTGRWKQEFATAFKENNSQLDESLYASSHNQYLNYMVKFGILGFILIMFLIIYPVVKLKRYRDPLFMIFLVYMFFANFADSNFETHMGSSFFFFFYCFFMIGPTTYLKIDKPIFPINKD